MLRIHKTQTTYHPQSNGLVERTNRTEMTILRTFSERHQSGRWNEILPQCRVTYKATVHKNTGYTSSLQTLGHELRLQIEVLTQPAPAEFIGLPQYVKELSEQLRFSYRIAAQHQSRSHHHQKGGYESTAKGLDYRIEDLIWLYRPESPSGLSTNTIARGKVYW
ncbi:uncharacterized protein DEA37_0002812 [Paragonimus westermani]|uniref:Integrase catalytic domain-containing protein n=1 Tax=Paragonimus westermani TaxID=34504 RepID=A0A5J4N5P1_9TREM|nr:uncharacterized protein DEA37_0002812 [Paragonimus westermani]